MDSVWIKVAVAAIAVVGGFIGVMMFLPGGDSSPSPAEQVDKQKTVYDVWEEDEERLRADPRQSQTQAQSQTTDQQAEQTQQQIATTTTQQQAQPAAEPQYSFKELDEASKYDAERLWNWIVQKRKMGRLPGGFGYKEMTDKCREIKNRYPDTIYDFYASRTLGDIPERYRKMYSIEDSEFDLSRFEVQPDQQ